MNNLPLYSATINDVNDGIYCISLVDCPATETQWVCFNKQPNEIKFSIDNEEEHIISSVVMLADTPIYRRDSSGYEYNIVYHKDVIKLMAEKMLLDNSHNNIDINHNGELLDKGAVSLVELFIKDEQNGMNPSYFSEIPDGSLVAKYKIHNEELWQSCKDGTLNGISLAGYFSAEQEFKKQNNKSKNMFDKIKKAIRDVLVEFGEIKTDKTIIYYDGEELFEGIYVTNEEGASIEDGDYTLEDGTILTITDSKIEKITPKAEDEPKEDETPEDVEKKDEELEDVVNDNGGDNGDSNADDDKKDFTEDIENIKSEIETLKGEMETIKGGIESIKGDIDSLKEIIKTISETPAAEPVAEEFKHIVDVKDNKAVKIASYLK